MRPLRTPTMLAHARQRWIVAALALAALLGAGAMLVAGTTPQAPGRAAESTKVATDTTAASHRVVAYYFHTTKRCVSCKKIEALAKSAIETGFAKDIEAGRLVWRVVNVEEKGNEHFVKDYQLFTKSVILVDERDGEQRSWKNLPKIWEYLNDKDRFTGYVQDETRAFMTSARS